MFPNHAQSFEHGNTGDPVIQVGRDQAGLQGIGRHAGHGSIPHLNQAAGLLFVFGTDVQVQIVDGYVLRSHFLAQGNHTGDAILETERGVQDTFRMDPTQLTKRDVSVLVDMGGDDANGIHVGSKHHLGSGPLFMYNQVAHGVNAAFVGIGFCQIL